MQYHVVFTPEAQEQLAALGYHVRVVFQTCTTA